MTFLTQQPIDYQALVEDVRNTQCGAVVLFLGTVREMSHGQAVTGLKYQAYADMADKKLQEILDQARQQWPIHRADVRHRHGHLELGDIAVAVVTASPHRAEAFAAGQWIMDTIKQIVPIWKQEQWVQGTPTWVHPGQDEPSPPPTSPEVPS